MNNEYIIVNKTDILKRIEELEKELAHHNEWYEKARERYYQDRKYWGRTDIWGKLREASDAAFTTAQEVKILKQILSQSTPLIPEIEKAFDKGVCAIQENNGKLKVKMPKAKQEYIANLKLDI